MINVIASAYDNFIMFVKSESLTLSDVNNETETYVYDKGDDVVYRCEIVDIVSSKDFPNGISDYDTKADDLLDNLTDKSFSYVAEFTYLTSNETVSTSVFVEIVDEVQLPKDYLNIVKEV